MPGWAVFHFAVTDTDQPTASSYFSFRLTAGNEEGMFRVDPDGTLRTTDKLNIRLGDVFLLTVRVNDGGTPNLFSSTWIYIKVTILYVNNLRIEKKNLFGYLHRNFLFNPTNLFINFS